MTTHTPENTPQTWPDGTTARIVTLAGRLFNNHQATVDITTTPHPNADFHRADCRPCGWHTPNDINRNTVLGKAQTHADQCTALPQPTA